MLLFIASNYGLEEPSQDVAALISHAAQERLKNLVEKLALIAEHRIDLIKVRLESCFAYVFVLLFQECVVTDYNYFHKKRNGYISRSFVTSFIRLLTG